MFVSKGIGSGYTKRKDSERNKYKKGDTCETYKTRKGLDLALPIYYRNKIYTEKERENLWIEKLDEQIRWVGNKIDISKGDEEYYKVLEETRKKNKRLGYGDNSINWERKHYEQQQRS